MVAAPSPVQVAKVAVAPAAEPVTPWTVPATPVKPVGNPYLANSVAYNQTSPSPFPPGLFTLPPGLIALPTGLIPNSPVNVGQMWNDLKAYLPEPHLPSPDIAILPRIQKVYPTGERPMYVLTFKCPTELIGITPLPTKALRWLISSGMDALNSTDLLPFTMQQVCE